MGRPDRAEYHPHHPRGRARSRSSDRARRRPSGPSSRRRTSASTGPRTSSSRRATASRSSSTPARAASRSTASSRCRGSSGAPRPASRRTTTGSSHVDQQCKVTGVDDVWAAGDGIAFPVKFGGLAAEQADAAAEAIAQLAGADVTPQPFKPVLRGRLLTGKGERYMHHVAGGGGGRRRGRRPRAVVAAGQGRRPPSRPVPGRARRSRRRRSRAAAGRPRPCRPTSTREFAAIGLIHNAKDGGVPMFKTIVVGVDGREGGRDALSLGARLALLAGGELVAVRVARRSTTTSSAAARPKYNSLARAGGAAPGSSRSSPTPASPPAPRVARRHVAGPCAAPRGRGGAPPTSSSSARPAMAGLGRVLAGDDVVGHAARLAVRRRRRAARPRRRGVEARCTRIGVGFDASPEAEQALARPSRWSPDCGATLEREDRSSPRRRCGRPPCLRRDWLDRSPRVAAQEQRRRRDRGPARRGLRRTSPSASAVDELVELSRDRRPARGRLARLGPGAADARRQHRGEAHAQGALPAPRPPARRRDRPAGREGPRSGANRSNDCGVARTATHQPFGAAPGARPRARRCARRGAAWEHPSWCG